MTEPIEPETGATGAAAPAVWKTCAETGAHNNAANSQALTAGVYQIVLPRPSVKGPGRKQA
jgi:hypothetical protein